MIDLEFLESLIRAIDESSIDSVEIERGGTRIRVSKSPPASATEEALDGAGAALRSGGMPAMPGAAGVPGESDDASGGGAGGAAPAGGVDAESGSGAGAASDGHTEIAAPMVGTFYRSPAPDAPPYVEVGDQVQVGDTLCIIEAMKLMNELECEVAGRVAEICVENADPVEYGQILFRIDPS